MSLVFFILLIIVFAFYAGLIALFIWGWTRRQQNIESKVTNFSYTILIAARNEAKTIALLLHDLTRQSFPMNEVQIVVVDDNSDDETIASARQFSDRLAIEVYSLPDRFSGKKAAIAFGLQHVAHDNIVFIDADCRVGTNWLRKMTQGFEQQCEGLLCGPVQFSSNTNGLFSKIMQLEFAFLVASGGAMARAKRAMFCNAANMIVDKVNYIDAQDYIKQTGESGDDVFLLHRLKHKRKAISFCQDSESIVYTEAPSNFTSFMQQRLRWAAKSKRYRDFDSIVVSCLVLLANLSIVVLAVGVALEFVSFGCFVLFYAFKTICDMLFFVVFAPFFTVRHLFWLVLILPFFYSLYVVSIVGLMFWYKPSWKGRRIRA